MTLKKIGRFVNDRLSLFVGIGIIISIHWGWYKLQQVPYLVNESERKNFPLLEAVRLFHTKIKDKIGSFSDATVTEEASAKSK